MYAQLCSSPQRVLATQRRNVVAPAVGRVPVPERRLDLLGVSRIRLAFTANGPEAVLFRGLVGALIPRPT